MKRKKFWGVVAAGLLVILAVPAAIAFLTSTEDLKRGLEAVLAREVGFEDLRFRFFPRPGIYATKFILSEVPEFGPEPFLYAREMRCYVSLAMIWRWKVECAQIQLIEPSLNLSRNAEGNWNLPALGFGGFSGEEAATGGALPMITITGGRINFKEGSRKLRFALVDVRLHLAPGEKARWEAQLDARPFRTDLDLARTGEFRLRGELGGEGEASSHFRFEADWPGGSFEQWVALVRGIEVPLRGETGLQLRFEGEPSRWTGTGEVTLDGLRRGGLIASESIPQWRSRVRVNYDAASSVLEIEEWTFEANESRVELSGRITDPLGEFDWTLDARSEQFDLGAFLRQLSALTASIPDDTRLDGIAQLAFHGESDREQWTGSLRATGDVVLQPPDSLGGVVVAGLDISLEKGALVLDSAVFRSESGNEISVGAFVNLAGEGSPYRLTARSAGIEVDELERTAAALGWSHAMAGVVHGAVTLDMSWSGRLGTALPPRWDGTLDLVNARIAPADFAAPLPVSEARFKWDRGILKIEPVQILLGGEPLSLSLEKRPGRPYWSARVEGETLDLGALHTLLRGEEEGLLEQLVGGERPRQIPWEDIWVQGVVAVGQVTAGPFTLSRFDARGELRMNRLDISRLRFRAYRGRFDGNLRADFLESPPQYRLAGNLRRFRLGDMLQAARGEPAILTGLLGAEVLLESAGDDSGELWRNLSGAVVGSARDGQFAGLNILSALAGVVGTPSGRPAETGSAVTTFQSLAGGLRFGKQLLETDDLRLIVGGAAVELKGSVAFDGALDLRLTGRPLRVGRRRPSAAQQQLFEHEYRLSGTLTAPLVELAPDKQNPGD